MVYLHVVLAVIKPTSGNSYRILFNERKKMVTVSAVSGVQKCSMIS